MLIALIAQSFLSAAIRYRQWSATSDIVIPYLTLVPQLSLVYPWVFLTTTLVEGNIFTLAISGVTLYYGGRYLERAWSSAELAKFVVIVSLIPNILCFGTLVSLLALTGSESWT
jgi:membrane associated rhomboid family serine protease